MKLTYLALAISISTLTSCEKFLDLQPKATISSDGVINDQSSAEQALRGVYRDASGSSYLELSFLASGDVTFNNVGEALNIINFNFRADNPFFASAWAAQYSTINRANNVIAQVPKVEDAKFTDQARNKVLGEAYFLRAISYFDLVRAWGGVPLKLEPTENLSKPLEVQRSTAEQTSAQIEADLNNAEQLLADGVNRVRVTRNTVKALKARLYLYQKKWADAEIAASTLIANSQYALVSPFRSWVKGDPGSTESILEYAHSAQSPNSVRNQLQHTTRGGGYSISPNARLVTLLKNSEIGGTLNDRRAQIDSLVQAGNTIWFSALYYRSPATDPNYVLRIAEQYLIRSEARARTGKLTEAISDLNVIRKRANLSLFTAAQLSTADAILLAIETERRFEFLWEPDRWYNLVRTGRAKAALTAENASRSIEDHELLFPIPNDEILLGKLTQNPGY